MNQRSETYIRVLERRIAKLQELFPKWISVEDALPDSDISVLVYADCACSGSWNGEKKNWHDSECRVVARVVTHWMPLPDPPNICTE